MEILELIPDKLKENNLIKFPNWVNKLKIDVGLSHNAPNSSVWLDEETDLLVIGIEPNPTAIKIIKGEINPPYKSKYVINKKYIDENFFILPIALSNHNSIETFYSVKNKVDANLNGYDLGSSSLNKPVHFEYDEIKTPVFRLDELLKLIDWSKIGFISQIKIDAQGEDFNIVFGIGDYLDKIAYLTIETTTFNQYHNIAPKIGETDKLLFDNGYTVINRTNTDTTYFNTKYDNIKNNIKFSVLG